MYIEPIPSGNFTQLWKVTIFHEKTHYKWSFSVAYVKLPEVNMLDIDEDNRDVVKTMYIYIYSIYIQYIIYTQIKPIGNPYLTHCFAAPNKFQTFPGTRWSSA